MENPSSMDAKMENCADDMRHMRICVNTAVVKHFKHLPLFFD